MLRRIFGGIRAASAVTLAAAQTLTNKTLLSPILTSPTFTDNIVAMNNLGIAVARCTTALTKTNDITLENIPGLSVNLSAGKSYLVRGMLHCTCSEASGIKWKLNRTVPSSLSLCTFEARIYDGQDIAVNSLYEILAKTVERSTTTGGFTVDFGGGAGILQNFAPRIEFEGIITTSLATAITIQGAQSVSDGTPAVFTTNSFLEVVECSN